MSEVISRQEATTIPVMPKEQREYQTMNLDDAYEQGWFDCQKCIEELPSADLSDYCDKLWKLAYERGKAEGQEEQKKPCGACGNLENGDTLYSMSDWDGGIGFDYIRDIEYCPVCGRKL